MNDKNPLPKFRNPPVTEVSIGIQFGVPSLTQTHIGSFHLRVSHDYPSQEIYPVVPAQFETFGGPAAPSMQPFIPFHIGLQTPQFGYPGFMPQPLRTLFISPDQRSVLQLQSDRLYVNWRNLGDDSAVYPHFEAIQERFSSALDALKSVREEHGLPPLAINQCEVFYGNVIATPDSNVPVSQPEDVFRCWNHVSIPGDASSFEDLSFNARYQMTRSDGTPFGRVYATLSTGARFLDGATVFQLGLSARGVPAAPTEEAAFQFHAEGREQVVRAFAAMTTDSMHKQWERYQ